MRRTLTLTIRFDKDIPPDGLERCAEVFREQIEHELLTGSVGPSPDLDGGPWGWGGAHVESVSVAESESATERRLELAQDGREDAGAEALQVEAEQRGATC